MTNKRQLTLHLDADTAGALAAEAQKRGLNLSRMTNDVLRRVLIDESSEKVADTIKARLDRLDKREAARAHEQALQKEILLLFIRVWFEYAGAPPEDESEASSLAEERFQGFLEMLAGETR
jgi:hypothetical protein